MTDKKNLTRKELEKELREIREHLNDIRVLGANLESGRRAKLEAAVKELEKLPPKLEALEQNFYRETERTNGLVRTVQQLTRASNAAALVVNTMETWLDENHPGWDGGAREAAERKAELLKQRASLAKSANSKDIKPEEKVELAEQLWEISKELGSEIVDVPMILSLYLQARNAGKARKFVLMIREMDLELPKDTEDVVSQLEARLEELSGEPLPTKMPPKSERKIISPA